MTGSSLHRQRAAADIGDGMIDNHHTERETNAQSCVHTHTDIQIYKTYMCDRENTKARQTKIEKRTKVTHKTMKNGMSKGPPGKKEDCSSILNDFEQ